MSTRAVKKTAKSVPKTVAPAVKKAAAAAANVIPDSLPKAVDLYYKTREKRLAMDKKVQEVAQFESDLRQHLINNISKSDASGVAGKVARVTVKNKEIVRVSDWTAFYAYIKRTGSFDLLQRRVADTAVKERLDAKKKVAGTEIIEVPQLSMNKV